MYAVIADGPTGGIVVASVDGFVAPIACISRRRAFEMFESLKCVPVKVPHPKVELVRYERVETLETIHAKPAQD